MGQVRQFGRRRPPSSAKRRTKPKRSERHWLPTALGTCLVIALGVSEFGFPLAGCRVKGNISRYSGERIYHVPGQENYSGTRINWLSGERWFCSEEAARNAGWRRAGR